MVVMIVVGVVIRAIIAAIIRAIVAMVVRMVIIVMIIRMGSPNYNPRRSDYPVFLATSERSGKDNSGDYTYRIGPDNAPQLNKLGQRIVEHDLDEIVDAFRQWGEREGISFCREQK
jgi:hypothetical protein